MRALAVVVFLVLVGCRGSPAPDASRGHVRLINAPQTSATEQLIAEQRAASASTGRTLVVYVGAPWCEPCRYFHDAAEKGLLDAELGDVDLLVFDAQVDAERLLLAGYESRFIPLLVVPGADGRATDRRMEGSIKGPGAVAEMTPRLRQLLGR